MDYDTELWNKYTNDNADNKHPEISTFIYNICSALGANKILEAGCNVSQLTKNCFNPFSNEILGIKPRSVVI